MILLVTNQRDLTMDYIVRELKKQKKPYYRLNTERITSSKCRLGNSHLDDWSIDQISGSNIKAAYFRRPGPPQVKPHHCNSDVDKYLSLEWHSFLKSLYGRLDKKWLNSPNNIALAEDKPKQLLLARGLGFSVPENVITNDINPAVSLFKQHTLIAKPLKQALLEDGDERVIFTNRIEHLSTEQNDSLSFSPVIFQQEIVKKFDVRVTVIGQNIFATAIYSQSNKETTVDWRKSGKINLKHELIKLPLHIEQRCLSLTEALNLKFGAIDLICDKKDNYWFLEINPNGQWAWIENQTQAPISKSIVSELLTIGNMN